MATFLVHFYSHAVDCAVIDLEQEKPVISFFESFITNTDLSRSLKNYHQKLIAKKIKIDSVECVLGESYVRSSLGTAFYSSPKPIKVDKMLLEKILREHSSSFDASVNIPKIHLENKIINTKLNGYQTLKPYGKEVLEIEISYFRSFISDGILNEIKELFGSFSKDITLHSFSYIKTMMLSSRSTVFTDIPSPFLLIEIEEDSTTLFFLEDTENFELETVFKGSSSMNIFVQKELHVDSHVAKSLLTMYSEGTLDEQAKIKVEKALEAFRDDWKKEIQKIHTRIVKKPLFGGSLCITASKKWKELFTKTLREDEYISSLYGNNAQIFDADSIKIEDLVIFKDSCRHPFHSALVTLFLKTRHLDN